MNSKRLTKYLNENPCAEIELKVYGQKSHECNLGKEIIIDRVKVRKEFAGDLCDGCLVSEVCYKICKAINNEIVWRQKYRNPNSEIWFPKGFLK